MGGASSAGSLPDGLDGLDGLDGQGRQDELDRQGRQDELDGQGGPAKPVVSRPVRWAAHAVALSVLPSGVWRFAIAFGWDSGFDGFLDPSRFPGKGSFYLVGLSLFAEALALLTLGLVQRWGEVLPRWVPGLGGRRIPTMAAVIPASVGAALVTYLGLVGAFTWNSAENMGAPEAPDGVLWWVMTVCYAPLVLWGPLLALVTVSYYRRRNRGMNRGMNRRRNRRKNQGG
ncbi:hypothetical protein [Streptomyces sp. KLOTTS4A1]|uniref:hypothetical protein n=1 Tax=Streptomyces sp. KLOTTS4A1 TaxID=3390996 RepID=UPI0039F4D721